MLASRLSFFLSFVPFFFFFAWSCCLRRTFSTSATGSRCGRTKQLIKSQIHFHRHPIFFYFFFSSLPSATKLYMSNILLALLFFLLFCFVFVLFFFPPPVLKLNTRGTLPPLHPDEVRPSCPAPLPATGHANFRAHNVALLAVGKVLVVRDLPWRKVFSVA